MAGVPVGATGRRRVGRSLAMGVPYSSRPPWARRRSSRFQRSSPASPTVAASAVSVASPAARTRSAATVRSGGLRSPSEPAGEEMRTSPSASVSVASRRSRRFVSLTPGSSLVHRTSPGTVRRRR
ncbi:hypothetical protein [Nonomuraea maheshkhaliensis]|uniref:hypothetical protein n=1 Tax=Nonomuraea maheshkhaliensis TaxID=419590 RepID=UPI0031FA1E49